MPEEKHRPTDSEEKPPSGLAAFWTELKRRKVMRVGITYTVVAWLVIQIAVSTFPSLYIPQWALSLVIMCVLLGFPVAIILAWAFELTPDGIKTTRHAREEQGEVPVSKQQDRKNNRMAFAFAAAVPTLIFGILAGVFFFKAKTAQESQELLTNNLLTQSTDKSIAVLPFTNMSANQEHAYFADGVHETILTDLANLRELRVISRTSVMQYRGTTKTMPEIGRELGVAYILEGSMQRAGDQFRLTAQLIDARNDEHLWAKNFDGELTNIFSVQSELARNVAQGLHAILSPQEGKALNRPATDSIAAYDLYLKAQASSIIVDQRLPLLEQAVTLDPGFTDAWLAIANVIGFNMLNGLERSSELERKAKQAIDKAVELDPESPDVLVGLGSFYYQVHLDYSRARFYVEKVAEQLPQHHDAQRQLGAINRREGRFREAISHLKQAELIDSSNTRNPIDMAETYDMHREWDQSIEIYEKMVSRNQYTNTNLYRQIRNDFFDDGLQSQHGIFIWHGD